ncbi:retropepsin-like aspartic protease [Brachyspira aalborgi]|uniref:Retroviral-like aspartic protease n=1 Tax=Brachyspira aalborgi TaxID=29522 RepID=A0A5C8FS40_9SPIR|nr:retropepsin-like aspartic protease [Brachyspira aalborgi]TXJ52487.1 hypothetical protein EPJ84_02370 [Brachyspira aalborgi]
MPKFTLPLNNQNQLIAPVFIILDNNMPPKDTLQARALFYTGANVSCITESAAKHLKLKPIGKVSVATASNNIFCNKYRIKLSLPFPTNDPFTVRMSEILNSEVTETQNNPNFDIIIGMDIISLGILIVSGNTFTFSI